MAIYDNLQKRNASMFPLQEKSATPAAEEQIIEADPDHYGLSKVTVAAAELQGKSATPTAEEQIIEADPDHYGLSKVTVAAAKLQEKTVTPTSEKQTVKPGSGYYGLSKVTVEAAEQREILLQAKAVDPTESTQLIEPDPGYDGLSSVAVGAIPETEIKLQEKTVTPTSEKQTIKPESGYDGLSTVTVEAVPEIKLQEKTATPTEEEQTIVPDPGYDGLSSVVVGAAKNSSGSGDCHLSRWLAESHLIANGDSGSWAIGESKFYYGEYILPEPPWSDLNVYPYLCIRENKTSGNYDLLCGTHKFTVNDTETLLNGGDISWYQIPIDTANDASEWKFYQKITSDFALDAQRYVTWANHDIYKQGDVYIHGIALKIVE